MNKTIFHSSAKDRFLTCCRPRFFIVLCLSLVLFCALLPNLATARRVDPASPTAQEKAAAEKAKAEAEAQKINKEVALVKEQAAKEKKHILDSASKSSQTKLDSLKKVNSGPFLEDRNDFSVSVIVICFVSLVIIGFLIYSAADAPKNGEYALGLPNGSIRAIIAVISIVFYILVTVALSMYAATVSAIAVDLTKTLGTLVVAISAFYFGSKTAEQGAKNAVDNLNKALNGIPEKSAVDATRESSAPPPPQKPATNTPAATLPASDPKANGD